jgi:hypothetical protein
MVTLLALVFVVANCNIAMEHLLGVNESVR